jgi:hypothetical protein
MKKRILILVKKEELRRGYRALLELRGYAVHTEPDGDSFAVAIVNMGDDLPSIASRLDGVAVNKTAFVVSDEWTGAAPLTPYESIILRGPVDGEKLINAIELKMDGSEV